MTISDIVRQPWIDKVNEEEIGVTSCRLIAGVGAPCMELSVITEDL